MNKNEWTKVFLAAAIAFFGAGGACYDLPEPVSSEKMVAADVFTSYRIRERSGGYAGKCSRQVLGQFWKDNKVYQMNSGARATYNDQKISTAPTEDQTKTFDFDCANERAEFVLTDNQGGTKRDVYETKKVKFDFPAEINPRADLRVPVDFDDKYDYEFEGWIEPKNDDAPNIQLKILWVKNEAEFAERLKNPDIPKNLSYFLRGEKLLVIPAPALSALAAGDQTATIKVVQRFYKPKYSDPKNSLKSASFVFEYDLNHKLRLKSGD